MVRTSQPADPARIERITELDLLRFVAALSVVGFHYLGSDGRIFGTPASTMFPSLAPVFHFGSLGVLLFFAISGFVILMSAWDRTVDEFAVSRIARLFPAYWFAVALVAIVALGFGLPESVRLTAPEFLTNLTMMQQGMQISAALPVFWTLWVELRFYVLIGLFILVGITYRRVVGFLSAWLLLTGLFAFGHIAVLDQTLLFPAAPYFVAGMAAFLIRRYGSTLLVWLLFFFAWLMALRLHGYATWPFPGLPMGPSQQLVEGGVITVIFAIMAVVGLGWLRRLNWRGLTFLGALTYPLYLLHHWTAELVVGQLGLRDNGPLGVLVATASALLVAWLVYLLVERPGQRALRNGLRRSLARMRELAQTQSKLPETQGKPPETQGKPSETQGKLPEPHAKLSERQEPRHEPRHGLAETQQVTTQPTPEPARQLMSEGVREPTMATRPEASQRANGHAEVHEVAPTSSPPA